MVWRASCCEEGVLMAQPPAVPTYAVIDGTHIITWPAPDGTRIAMHDPHEDRSNNHLAFVQVHNAQGDLINEGTLRYLDSGDCLRFAQRCAAMNGTQPEPWNARLLYVAHHVQESLAQAPWPLPQPLPDGLRAVRPLPERLLPDALKPWLVDIAERLQVPLEFPAVAAIVALASVVGNQVRFQPKARDDWTVTPNLWGGVVGRPGMMKSPALQEALRPLYRLVKQAEDEHKEAMKG